MRDIEFRGKCVRTGELVYGSLQLKASGGPRISTNDEDSNEWCPVEPDSIQQYSGINDKTGRRLFEGDLIKHNGAKHKNVVMKIVFEDGAFCLEGTAGNEDYVSNCVTIRDAMFQAVAAKTKLELTYHEEEVIDLFA